MKADVMLENLEAAATALSVKVSYESLAASVGQGGLCKVKGTYRVIVDKRASAEERVGVLARALCRFDVSELELKPKVRELVEYYAIRRAS